LGSEIIFSSGVKGYLSKMNFSIKYLFQQSFNLETKPIGQISIYFLLQIHYFNVLCAPGLFHVRMLHFQICIEITYGILLLWQYRSLFLHL